MNLGPQRIADTYQLVLNQSGSSVTLGNGNNPNWIGTTVASTTGNQTISGVKTFVSTINANITGSAGSATSAASAISASGLFLTTSDGNASSTTMYPVLFSGTTVGGNQRAHIDSAGLSYNALTNALTATSFIGNASTATSLANSRTINGTGFNGTSNIIIEPYIESDNSTNALRYLTFVDSSTDGYQRLNESSNLTYNPSNGALTTSLVLLGTQTNKATISYATNTARIFALPDVTQNTTFAVLDRAQVFTTGQTINANLRVQGNLDLGNSSLVGAAHSSLFKTNGGTLGVTSGNTINLASIGFGATEGTSLSFIARRQSNGSNAGSSAIGLSYNTGDITGINNQQIWMLADGKVGVGTNAPTEKLDINGNLKVNGSISGNTILSNVNAKLPSDVSLLTNNIYYDITGISLTSGTWLLNSSILHNRTSATAENIFCRISGSSTIYASTTATRPATANYLLNLSMSTIIPLTTTTTITLQAATSVTATAGVSVVKSSLTANNVGNNATQITAIRIA